MVIIYMYLKTQLLGNLLVLIRQFFKFHFVGGKDSKVVFADQIVKYDRRFKPTNRELVMTTTQIFIIAVEKVTKGPEKGKLIKVVKRQIPLTSVVSLSTSTKSDDFIILKVSNDYDTVFENVCKTEMMTLLSENFKKQTGRDLPIQFNDKYLFH